MKSWRSLTASFLVICLCLLVPYSCIFAEEDVVEADGEGQEETEEAIPDSYYYPIESNDIKNWPQGPSIEAASATVLDMNTGTFLYSKQAKEKQYPASITKILTTLLLVENCDLDDEITFSEIVYDLEEGSSHLGIQPGEKMTLRDAAYGIMLASANDIANGVAEYIGGSISGFAELMNEKAAQLGCVNTHFSNPHGLYSDDHYTCAYDMALIAKAAYENATFREIVTTRFYTIPKTNLVDEERYLTNHHKMMQKDEEYYWQYCTGGKTGFTSQCLNTLVTYAEKDGKSLVSVVLRVNGAGKAYDESRQILEYGFDNFSSVNYKRTRTEKTFYDIMGLNYLGTAASFQSEAWKRSPYADCLVALTLPNTVSASELNHEVIQEEGAARSISYQYEGIEVGKSSGCFYPICVPAQQPFMRNTRTVIQEDSAEQETADGIQIEGLDDVISQTSAIFRIGYAKVKGYAESHMMVVIAGGAVILALILIFIVVLIFRCTSDYRLRRRRRQEEKERRRREDEIDRMTTAEIEAELRAYMEQEQHRREQETLSKAEAERAADQAEK